MHCFAIVIWCSIFVLMSRSGRNIRNQNAVLSQDLGAM
jgi:hypothetical protein